MIVSRNNMTALTRRIVYHFGGSYPPDTNVYETKHNPLKERDLRGYEQYQHLSEYERDYQNFHNKR